MNEATARRSALPAALFGRSEIRRRIIALLYLDPDVRLHLREIARRAQTSAGTARRELGRLEAAGLVERTVEGRQVYHRATRGGPLAASIAEIVRRTMGAGVVLRQALDDVAGIESATIFGSYASGRMGPMSDIDLLIVGAPDRDVLTERLEAAGRDLGRPINEIVYAADDLAARRARGDGFLRAIDGGDVIEVLP
jgi:predicted nucleotidyltransferase